MALVSRCVYVLHHLQSKLDQSSPSPQAFLKYREQVVTEGTSQELKNLLEIEHQLSNEQNSLLLLIQKVKDDEKKKAFACSTQKLIVVEKKLKEISKQLNRRLMESDYVNMNLDKMLDVIHHWIKQRVEQGAQLVLSCTNDPDLLVDTTIQKKEKMMALESKMTRAITVMLKDDERIKGGENCLEALKQRIDGAKAELAVFQNGTDPTLTRRYRDIQVRKESTHRIFAYEKNKIKEEIANAKDQLLKDADANEQIVRYLKGSVSAMEDELRMDKESNSREIQQLDSQFKDASDKRERNLKDLLQLRVKWKHYEEEQDGIQRERERLQEMEILELKRREAVEIIGNRLSLLCKSKFQNKRSQNKRKKKKK